MREIRTGRKHKWRVQILIGLTGIALSLVMGAIVIFILSGRPQIEPQHQQPETTRIPPELKTTAGPSAAPKLLEFADGSVVVAMGREAAAANLRIEFEEPPEERIPSYPAGFPKVARVFRISAFDRKGEAVGDKPPYLATLDVLLNELDLILADGDPYRLAIHRFDEMTASWGIVPSTVDLPWLRAEIVLESTGLYLTAATPNEREIDRRQYHR